MEKYIVLSRWTPLAGQIPDERKRGWMIQSPTLRPFDLWENMEGAENYADGFAQNFQPGFIETCVVPIDLPD